MVLTTSFVMSSVSSDQVCRGFSVRLLPFLGGSGGSLRLFPHTNGHIRLSEVCFFFLIGVRLVRVYQLPTLAAVVLVVLEGLRGEDTRSAAPEEEDTHQPEVTPGPSARLRLHFRMGDLLAVRTWDLGRHLPEYFDMDLCGARV